MFEVRRRAIYAATLKPGATGRSVSDELGVSAKTVSLASAEFRRDDLALLHRLVAAARSALPDDVDVEHASAMLSNSSAVGVAVHVVARLFTPWLRAADFDDGEDDAWWEIHTGFERAEYLSKLAGLQRSPRAASVDGGAADDERTAPELRVPCRVLNAMPGIRAFGTTRLAEHSAQWTLWWSIASADRNLDVADVGPSREGWLVSEWLVWLARDYRKAGELVESRVNSLPPMLNTPGAMLTFAIDATLDGPLAVDPHEFARSIITSWSGDGDKIEGSGYFDIEWPPKEAR